MSLRKVAPVDRMERRMTRLSFRSTPINGHQLTGPAGPFRAGRRGSVWPAQASTSNPFHSPVTNHSKVDPVDQIRTEHLGGAHDGHRLSQRADVRSERHDAAPHRGNRTHDGVLRFPDDAERADA